MLLNSKHPLFFLITHGIPYLRFTLYFQTFPLHFLSNSLPITYTFYDDRATSQDAFHYNFTGKRGGKLIGALLKVTAICTLLMNHPFRRELCAITPN